MAEDLPQEVQEAKDEVRKAIAEVERLEAALSAAKTYRIMVYGQYTILRQKHGLLNAGWDDEEEKDDA